MSSLQMHIRADCSGYLYTIWI